MYVFDDFLSLFCFEEKMTYDKVLWDFLLMLCLNGQVNMFNNNFFASIGPILLRLFLEWQRNYPTSGIVKVAQHDNRLDIFLVNHFPELWSSQWSGSLCKNSEIFAINDGFHVTGVAVIVRGTWTGDSAMIISS